MADHPLDVNDVVRNRDPFVQHNIILRNDLNARPVQISVNIHNTNNFNFFGQELNEEDNNRNRLQRNTAESTDEEEEGNNDDDDGDDDDDDNHPDTNDEEDDENTSDEDSIKQEHGSNFPTPPNVIPNTDDNNH